MPAPHPGEKRYRKIALNAYKIKVMQFRQFVKYYIPSLYYQFQQRKFIHRLPERYHTGSPMTFIMKDRQAGFFSLFFQVLGAADFCRRQGHNLIIDFCNGPYVDKDKGNNWWTYYFESDRFLFVQPWSDGSEIIVEEQGHFADYGRNLPFKIGYQLISDLGIRPKEEISYVVANFVEQNFQDQHIVGIHYRGTDKSLETPRVPYECVLDHLQRYRNSQFFVATDEAQFLEYLIKYFGKRVLYYDAIRSDNGHPIHLSFEAWIPEYREQVIRSGNGQPIHLSRNVSSNYRAGKDALIDCLLLSNCNALVRTESNLSYACGFFNPHLKVTTLSIPTSISSKATVL